MPKSSAKRSPKRLLVISAVVCYVVFLGLPTWWYTTSISRPSLPSELIAQYQAQLDQRLDVIPLSLELYVVLPGVSCDDLQLSARLSHLIKHNLTQHGSAWPPQQLDRLRIAVTCEDDTSGTCTANQGNDSRDSAPSAGVHSLLPCLGLVKRSRAWEPFGAATPGRDLDAHLQHVLDSVLGPQQSGRHLMFVLPAAMAAGPATQQATPQPAPSLRGVTVGQHRSAWLTYSATQDAGGVLEHGLQAAAATLLQVWLSGTGSDGGAATSPLPVSAAGETVMSFSLCNADPTQHHYSWGDFAAFQQRYLQPLITALHPAIQVQAESQVLYYTAAGVNGSWQPIRQAHVLDQAQLPFFVDSDWHLQSGWTSSRSQAPDSSCDSRLCASREAHSAGGTLGEQQGTSRQLAERSVPSHVLDFVVYVPPPAQRPLLVQAAPHQPQAELLDSFWVPSWGGVFIANPSAQADTTDAESTGAKVQHGMHDLDASIMSRYAVTVRLQMRMLLGLAPHHDLSARSGISDLRILPPTICGIATWEAEALSRRRVATDLRSAVDLLSALARLARALPNLEMPAIIGQQVDDALSALQASLHHSSQGSLAAAATAAIAAHAAAEAAFSHPAVLAQLNFPESHKLGIYIPLFLPASLPLLQGLFGELRHLWQRPHRP